MMIVLNGPLGIGKSTLSELLLERIASCVMLDGDSLVAANPPSPNEVEHLHSTIDLLVSHHRALGYRHFVVNHLWTTAEDLDDLRRRLTGIIADEDFHAFLLTLPVEENLRRIHRRARAREIDELGFELQTVSAEREALEEAGYGELGEPFDVSGVPDELVDQLLHRIGWKGGTEGY